MNGRDGNILTTRVGLQFPTGLTFEAWEQAGPKLFRIVDSSAWYMGDWLAYGQDRYDGRYRLALDRAGLDYQTLRNYAWVARKFDISRRRASVSFQHHAEVASLEQADQDAWLDRAEAAGWSRNRLRSELRDSRVGVRRETPNVSCIPSMRVPRESLESWQQAAHSSGIGFGQWVVLRLDEAAHDSVANASYHP